MATVPVVSLPSVTPQAAPDVQQANPVNADLLNINNKQQEAFGGEIVKLGGDVDLAQKRWEDQANALRVADAVNLATEHAIRLAHDPKDGYTTQTGFAALNRDSGVPLADEYTSKLDQQASDIAATLGNDRQRQMFQEHYGAIRNNFLNNAVQYEAKQGVEYDQSVKQATISNAANALILNPLDEKNVEAQSTRIRAAWLGGVDPQTGTFIPGLAQSQGKSGAYAQEKAAESISSAHTAAIQSLMDSGNVNQAMAYRKKYGDQMQAADMIRVDGTLQRNYDTQQGAAAGSSVVQAAQPIVNPSDFDRLNNIIVGQESKGHDFDANGNLLQGPLLKDGTRAQGSHQVTPATAANPGYGIKPADMTGTPAQQAAELNRVGTQKLQYLVKYYNGDIAKAAAAYNWGEGNVDKAVKAAQENAGAGEQVGPTDWLASAPKETRAYVANVTAQFNKPDGGVLPRPTLEQLHQAALAKLGPNASPVAVQSARQTVSQQYADQTAALKQQADDAVSAVQQELIGNGGKFDQVTPSKIAAVTQNAPEKYDDLLRFAKAVSKGDNETNMAAYNAAITYPEELAKMSDAQFLQFQKTNFSLADQEKVGKLRASVINGTPDASTGALNNKALTDSIALRLESIGINAHPKPDDVQAQARIGTVKKFAADYIYGQQQQLGRKMTPQEVSDTVDSLFAKNVTFKNTLFGIETGGTSSQPLLGMKVGDIPSDTRAAIKQSFAARGQMNPSDSDILGAYFRWKGKNG
jgi:soluble lytic murein transglycosylase